MKTQRVWLLGCLFVLGSTFAHASALVNPILAIDTVPEPTSVLAGAGLLLVGLGMLRKRNQNK